ncbi:hypothetical protein DYB32_010605 [Aphanomyces invadans]|uniref:Uncharacterized protein n=1 Tax=Aphanomyces invadans TaxID=157072 RepID=A0A418AFG9_9STRA|nr:hypothetical protein DYB32_010605 [Aphanomyces invadans]
MLGRRRPHGKDLWNKLKAAVKTSKLEENQLRKYQSIQTQALHEESLVLRYGLRRHPGIVHAVQTLWDFDGPRDDLGCLVKAGYVAFYVRVAKLLDPAFDLSLATTTVEVSGGTAGIALVAARMTPL